MSNSKYYEIANEKNKTVLTTTIALLSKTVDDEINKLSIQIWYGFQYIFNIYYTFMY